MITSLLIDGIEVLPYLLFDEINKLRFRLDEGPNSLVCPTYDFTLLNTNNLEQQFLANYPYNLFAEGFVQLYVTNSFGTPVKRFEGYIDKDNSDIKKNAEKLRIYAVSKDKKIALDLSRHDVTQLYYNKDGSYPERGRGGRNPAELRFNYDEYNRIEPLITAMLEDIGITSYDISYSSQAIGLFLEYLYNEDKFGPIADQQTIGVARNNHGRGDGNPWYKIVERFVRNETDTESYDSLMKEFAKIAGATFFYEPTSGKFIFMPRNRPYGTTIDITHAILYDTGEEYEIPIKYKNAYNGLILEFDDLSLLLKIKIEGGAKVYEYGVDAQQGMIRYQDGDYYLELDPTIGVDSYWLGTTEFNPALFIENGLRVKFNGKFKNYFKKLWNRVDYFMQGVAYNYYHTLGYGREAEMKLNGLFFPPFTAKIGTANYGCWYAEVDFNKDETMIKIDVDEFDLDEAEVIPYLVEDDTWVLV